MDAFTVCDWVAIALCALFAFFGLIRGFSDELGGICGLVSAACLAIFGHPFLMSFLKKCNWNGNLWIVLIVELLACVFVWMLVRALVRRLVSAAIPQPINALLGAAMGFGKSLGLFVLLVLFIRLIPIIQPENFLKFNCSLFRQVDAWACSHRTTCP